MKHAAPSFQGSPAAGVLECGQQRGEVAANGEGKERTSNKNGDRCEKTDMEQYSME